MISFISSWAKQIVFAVIIGVIIQMIIPEGKNKKYIKIIIGVYVLFTIISPVVGKNLDLDFTSYNISIENSTNNTTKNMDNNINEIYTENLKKNIISKLENKGYGCESVEIETRENYELETIKITGIYEKENEKDVEKVVVNEVRIGEKENSIIDQVIKGIPESEAKKLKEYLSDTYNVKVKNISIE